MNLSGFFDFLLFVDMILLGIVLFLIIISKVGIKLTRKDDKTP